MSEEGKVNEAVANTNQVALELQQAISNYKKSPKERLTEPYINSYKEKIEQLWVKFQAYDRKLRNVLPETHKYYEQDTYTILANKVSEVLDLMEHELVSFKGQRKSNMQPGTSTTANNESASSEAFISGSSPALEYARQLKLIDNIKTRINQALEATDGSNQYYSLVLQTIEQHWKSVQMLHEKLLALPSNYDLDQFLSNEQYINEGMLKLQELVHIPTAHSNTNAVSTYESRNVKLPAVEIPKFDGNSLKWRQFRDLFVELVHGQNLPKCQKLWYLKTSLKGEAEQLIKHLSATADNYDTAWQILEERFENRRMLVNVIISRLINQAPVQADNASSIKGLHDITQECLFSLKNLNINVTEWDPIVLYLLTQKLNKNLHSQWENSLTQPRELPSVADFLKFLNVRFQSLESLGFRQGKLTNENDKKQAAYQSFSVITNETSCIICKQDHPLFKCHDFLKLGPPQRLNLVQRANCCVNCLKKGHKSKNCSSSSCLKCHKKHNTLLHLELQAKNSGEQSNQGREDGQRAPVSLTTVFEKELRFKTLLSTVGLTVRNKRGEPIHCRALLDSGSQVNLITKTFVHKLGLHKNTSSLEIEGIGHSQKHTSGRVNLHISSNTTNFNCHIEAHILPVIVSNQPLRKIKVANWKIPNNIRLADPEFAEPKNVDLLLGVGIFYQILSVGQISLGESLPTLKNSLFGWLIGGQEPVPVLCGVLTEDTTLEEKVENFWKLEECEQRKNTFTEAEQCCENHFMQNLRRSGDVMPLFVVSLPFTRSPSELGASKDIALQRFRSVERKMRSDPVFKAEYAKFMKEYEELGHMTQIPISNMSQPHYFLPHHAVLKPDSSTTKLRVVFDASAKTTTNLSLNDTLSKGPVIQDDVFSILIRFRLPLYAMTADVEKMYRQIWVNEDDRNLQLILWRENEHDNLKCYQLNTVTYGTSSAPYLAIRTLRAMADDLGQTYPRAADAIKKHFYVDDVLCGSDHLPEAMEIQRQLLAMFQSAGMKLRKWVTNHPRLLDAIPPLDREKLFDLQNNCSPDVKTMGLKWEPNKDLFKLKIGKMSTKAITKRSILSDIAQIFDPLGFIAPTTAAAKLLLQKLWKLKLDWDSSLPQDLHQIWAQFRDEIQLLQEIQVPRHVFGGKTGVSFQTHIFCEASEQAYGAVAYIRTTQPQNVVTVRFLCAKSKVAPVKQISLPRLELCAAKLGAELFQKLMESEQFQSSKVFFWTDSTAVLGWIKAESANYHTFIANRIAAIQRISSSNSWRHVRSEDNPADLISRGLPPSKLVNNNFWYYGPKFLHGSISCWPLQPPGGPCDLELRKNERTIVTTTTLTTEFLDSINHRNSFHFLKRVVATLLKVANRSRGRAELEHEALVKIVKLVQRQYFEEDIEHLKKYGAVKTSSAISNLTPFLDKDEVVRVGGRLEASNLCFDTKHPMLLPSQHKVTKLLLETIHEDNHHAGAQTLMSLVRQQFWPLKLKMMARATVQKCVKCARAKPKLLNQLMGDLPSDRVQPARPFVVSGVDFFGPVWTHFKIRGKRPLKAYVAVFCCFSTRAVHMELVSDLTTEAFLEALKRFIARRGHCRKLYCDNATNFVGAKNYIEELLEIVHSTNAQEIIQNECRKKCIEFVFIPPRAPHFGGLWEAAVKSAKRLLISTLSSAALTYEEMSTVIAEAEAILNSRPLTPMSSNPNDLQALTPGHFLIGEPLVSTIDATCQPHTASHMTRWKLINQLKTEFWERWRTEYLSTLQYRNKWKQEIRNIEPGTMVIIKEDNVPSMRWPLGRVIKAIPGPDGLVRVADVRTANNISRRPIHRLAALPTEDQDKETNTSENEQSPQPSKRRRLQMPSAMSIMIAIMIMLPLCIASSINVQPFVTNPGIYYEKIGTAGIAVSEWTLVSYVDMQSYWKKYEVIMKYPSALRKASNSSNNIIVKLSEGLLGELKTRNLFLSSRSHKRSKRGAINLIGNIANSLFGILDSNYAERAERDIELIKQNENYLIDQLRNQTSFLDATATVFRKSQEEINHELRHVSSILTSLDNKINSEMAFTELAIQAVFDMFQFERLQDSLSEVLLSSHHGKISPKLVSPIQLNGKLDKIKAILPNNLRLPSSIDNVISFYKLMRIEGRALENYIIFKLTLDLLNDESFEVLKIITVPWRSNEVFYQIQSQFKLLVINLHRDAYLPLRESEVDSCNLIDDEFFICHQRHPLYKTGANIALCEVQLLTHHAHPSCKIARTDSGPYWIQLEDRNTWIFSVPTNYTVNAVCGLTPKQIKLQNSGKLQLGPDCNIKQPEITIQGFQHLETKENNTFYIPINDIKTLIDVTPSTLELPQIKSSSSDIDELKESLSKLRIQLPNNLRSHNIHHYTMTYLCLATICGVAVIWYWKFKRTRQTDEEIPPTPAPSERTTNSQETPNEEFITIPS